MMMMYQNFSIQYIQAGKTQLIFEETSWVMDREEVLSHQLRI